MHFFRKVNRHSPMHVLDWTLLALPLLFVFAVGILTQRYMKSVADFMSGGRLAGPYLLAVAVGEQQAGVAMFVAGFELVRASGFTITWWQLFSNPAVIIVALTGFVIYRFRETRAMTLAQFFELRYSKKFRVFTGILGFCAGLVNFGIIPAIGARAMVYFLGFPPELTWGSWSIPTYIPLMAIFCTITLFLTLMGGLITVMITDCVEGIISQLVYLVIIIVLLFMFSWPQIREAFGHQPAGHSLLNPFDSMSLKDFNIWYVIMSMILSVYGTQAWQNASAYKSAAISAHAAKMGAVLGRWREYGRLAFMTFLAMCAITFLEHPDFATQSAPVQEAVNAIGQPAIQRQMELPIALSELLPIGIRGLLCAILLMGIFGGEATHLHSWGGIFVQDVLVPLRKKPFGPKQHIRILRLAITGVALFAFLFGVFFKQMEYVFMWWSVTMAIFIGGGGAVIIGGLYWKKGTTAGAWTALVTGSSLAVGGIIARQVYPYFADGRNFPLNGVQVSFCAMIAAVTLYIIVSLLTCREDYNMDRMLHRGKYAKVIEQVGEKVEVPAKTGPLVRLGRFIGFDKNYTTGDKWISGGLFCWSMSWLCVFLIGTAWNLLSPWTEDLWASYWHIAGLGLPLFIAFVTGIWFTWGGVRDIREIFRRLRAQKVNHLDDGTVVDHQNLDEREALKGH